MADGSTSEVQTEHDFLTQDMISEFKEVFSVFDKSGNGLIKIKYLKKVFKCLGQTPTQKEIDDMLNSFNMGGYKKLKFDDFLKLIERKMKETKDTETYYEVFKMFDKEETGYISASEIKYMMANLGEKLTDREVNEMLNCADTEENNKISYEEFVKMMKSLWQNGHSQTIF